MNRSKKAYLDALSDLLDEKPFERITVSEIIARSGYGRTGFYRQFCDKYALAGALVKDHARAYAKILAEDLSDASCDMETMVVHVLEHVWENRRTYHTILVSEISGHGFDEFCELALDDFRIMASARPTCDERDFDYDLFYYATTRQFADYLRYWDLKGYRVSVPQMARSIAGVIEHLAPGQALGFDEGVCE